MINNKNQVGRAGRFGTKGISITLASSDEDRKTLQEIQDKFIIKVKPLPDSIDCSTYSKIFILNFSEIINLIFRSINRFIDLIYLIDIN